jgi:hypothetical protein
MEAFKRTDVLETRVNSLDRTHGTTRFYGSLSLNEAKQRSKVAFAAYDDAVRQGDPAVAEAARLRFLAASERLKGGRR